MGFDHDVSRRRFLSAAITTTAASLLARPALSFPLANSSSHSADGLAPETSVATASLLPWQDQGVLNLANSPYAKLHTVPVRAVTIEEGFWSKRRKTNVEQQHPHHAGRTRRARPHGQLSAGSSAKVPLRRRDLSTPTPIFTNGWKPSGWALQSGDLPELRSLTASMIREVVAIQEPNGYLNTYFQGDHVSERMTPSHAGSRTRTVQPRPHAARSDRLLPRDRRSDAAGCRA